VSEKEPDKVVGIIKDYISRHLDDVSLEILAEKVYMSAPYVSKYFKAKTGINFQEYLITQRMQRASQLLEALQYNISEISLMVGYSNPFNFTRTYKKCYGMTPRDYRMSKLGRIRLGDGREFYYEKKIFY